MGPRWASVSERTRDDDMMNAPMPKAVVVVLMCVMRDAHWSCSATSGGTVITFTSVPRCVRISATPSDRGVSPPTVA
jgi:hypothetical protein